MNSETRSFPPLVAPGPELSAAELARYSRHLTLPGVGPEGQRRIRAARVLVIGAGGLGAPTLQYLAAAGVGRITIVDDDVVEASNLQRQVLHRQEDIGRPKAESARDALHRLDPALDVRAVVGRLGVDNALELFADHDLVLDGADNFATRYLSNDAAELTGTPLVWGTIFQFRGQVSAFWPGRGPMLRDLFPDIPDADSVPSCAEGGVFGVLCAVVGGLMANEALKLVCGIGEPLVGRFLRYDALAARTSELRFASDPDRRPVAGLEEVAAACLAASGTGAGGPGSPSGLEVAPTEAARLIETGEAVLVDVREDWERALVSVDGALPAPVGEIEREGWAALGLEGRSDPARELLFLCKSGVRSLRAARALEADRGREGGDPVSQPSAGTARLRSVAGGIVAWKRDLESQEVVY